MMNVSKYIYVCVCVIQNIFNRGMYVYVFIANILIILTYVYIYNMACVSVELCVYNGVMLFFLSLFL